MADLKKTKYERRLAGLKVEVNSGWRSHWIDLSDYTLPRRGRFLSTEKNKGSKKNPKIIDNTATLAARALASGMMAGITSPARPWFRLTTPDPGLMEFGPVKEWLFQVERLMREIFARSNFYNTLHTNYLELGVFGTGPMSMEKNFDNVIHCKQFTAGSYYLDINDLGQVDTMYREVPLTVKQIVNKFGQVKPSGIVELSNISRHVRDAFTKGNYNQRFIVVHALEPNKDRDIQSNFAKDKPWSSVYYEQAGNEDMLLSESGFDTNPVMAPRWMVTGEDVYGSSPGMDALGDSKALQIEQREKAKAIQKQINPPMTGPSSLANQTASVLPGEITYADTPQGQGGFRPAYEVRPYIQEMVEDIRDVRNRIDQAYYKDLFLMLSNMSGVQPRNDLEILERKEEKLLQIGPALERVHNDLLDPAIDFTFGAMNDADLLPEPPEEIQGIELGVEYISMLAQAQKAVGTSSIQSIFGFVGSLAEMYPKALDKLDPDQAIDEFGEMIGVSPKIIIPDEKVAEKREADDKAAQAQQQMAMMAQGVDSAKTMSEIDTQGHNALTDSQDLMGQQAPGGQ